MKLNARTEAILIYSQSLLVGVSKKDILPISLALNIFIRIYIKEVPVDDFNGDKCTASTSTNRNNRLWMNGGGVYYCLILPRAERY